MGFFDFAKAEVQRQFIARPDDSKSAIIYKWPDSNIRLLTQLTVQPDETALFIKSGQVVGTLGAGVHNLDGADIPFIGGLIDAATGGNYLISELYFVSTRQFPSLPFGGLIDNVLDPTTKLAIALRVFGEYAIKVENAQNLILNLVGTQSLESNDQLTDWFKQLLMKVLKETVSDMITNQNKPVLGISSQTSAIEAIVLDKVKAQIAEYGVVISKLGNFTITIKEEDEAMLKQMTRDFAYSQNMAAADAAVKLGMAEGLKSSNNGGGIAGQAVSAGIGLGMASSLMQGANGLGTPNMGTQPAAQPVQPTPVQPAQ
jgi:membrane protease subunit (stomatin/prohibitin family)